MREHLGGAVPYGNRNTGGQDRHDVCQPNDSPGSAEYAHRKMRTGKHKFVVERLVQSKSRLSTMRVNRPTSHQLKLTGEGFLEKAARL